jgi:hypothetical protein
MFNKKTKERKQKELILEVLTNEDGFIEKIKELIVDVATDQPELIMTQIDKIIADPKRLKKFERSLDVARAQRLQKEFEHLVDELDDKEIEMENSTKPWFELVVSGVDDERGFPVKMACNSAFLKSIEEQGIQRGPKEDMIQRWLQFATNSDEHNE